MRFLLAMSVPIVGLAGQTITIDDLRAAAREAAQAARYATFLAGFLGLTGEAELSGARFEVDDEIDTDFTLVTYPLHRELPLGDSGLHLRIEGDFGYAQARLDVDDLYGGAAPAVATRAKSRYEAFGGFLGAGVEVPIGAWTWTPLALGGLAHVENDTYYQGPGASVSALAFDGILFNWEATYLVYGGALLLQRSAWTWGDVCITPRLRYDLRRTDPMSTDDPSQDDPATLQWLIARLDVEGPTSWQLQGRDVRWTGELGYKRFLDTTGGLLGFDDYFEIGAGLRWPSGDLVPLLDQVGFGGSLLLGEHVFGWTVGLAVQF